MCIVDSGGLNVLIIFKAKFCPQNSFALSSPTSFALRITSSCKINNGKLGGRQFWVLQFSSKSSASAIFPLDSYTAVSNNFLSIDYEPRLSRTNQPQEQNPTANQPRNNHIPPLHNPTFHGATRSNNHHTLLFTVHRRRNPQQ